MDKETLSHYGWIVILVLILAVLLALATPFGTFVADGFKATYAGFEMVGSNAMNIVDIITGDETPVGNSPDTVFTENPDGTVDGVTPAEDSQPEIPADEMPSTIEFTFGKFESVSSYTAGEYATIEYQKDEVQAKKPVGSVGIYTAHWKDGKAVKITLSDMGKTSTYIVYNLNTGEYSEFNGVKCERVLTYRIMEDADDTLNNAIYLAAYLNHTKNIGLHIAKWNGTQYETLNCDAEINAITTFTEVVTVTKTKQVVISEASYNSSVVFIPLGTLKAESGMTWGEWLTSEYNTTGENNPTVRLSNYETVNRNSIIEEGKEYSLYEAKVQKQPGLYVSDSNYGTISKSWATLLNDGTLSITSDGLLKCNDKTLAGDLVIANDENIVGIANEGFAYCDNLTSVTIPGNIKIIHIRGFYSCKSLKNVELCEGIEGIYQAAFRSCESLIGLTLPDSLTHFESYGGALMFNMSMQYIHFGKGMTVIPSLTYTSIPELIVPEGYIEIEYQTILTKFETVYIPTSVTKIGRNDSTLGSGLKEFANATIYYAGTEEQWNAIENSDFVADTATIIFNHPYTDN